MLDPVDFVIPLGTGSRRNDDELRLLLRSLELNGMRYRDVIVVATRPPEWLCNARIIQMDDPLAHNKDGNIIRKVLAAAALPDITHEFVWSCDDCVFLKPIDCANLPPIHNDRRKERFPENGSIWQRRVRRTFEFFEAHGVKLDCNFESHTPQRFPTRELLGAMRGVDYSSGIGYSINTLFYGLLGITRGFDQSLFKDTNESIGDARTGKMLCQYNDEAFTTGLRERLFQLFPKPCRYEKKG